MATSKVVYSGTTLIDLTSDTVSTDTLAAGVTAHSADGELVTGTYSPPVTSVNGLTGAVTLSASDVGAAAVRSFSAKLTTAGWSATAPYTQSVTVAGILATDGMGRADADLSAVTAASTGSAILEAWSCVSRIYASANNTLTALCYESTPETDIPIRLEVLR